MEFLSKELRAGIESARKRDQKRRARLRVKVGEDLFPILRLWETGFALDAASAPPLRGLVDIYDGSRHILQCLIVASVEEDGEMVCDFKWSRPAEDRAPVDFERDEGAPVGYLPRA